MELDNVYEWQGQDPKGFVVPYLDALMPLITSYHNVSIEDIGNGWFHFVVKFTGDHFAVRTFENAINLLREKIGPVRNLTRTVA